MIPHPEALKSPDAEVPARLLRWCAQYGVLSLYMDIDPGDRSEGSFEPGRLPMEDMEYTTMPSVAERLSERWEPIKEPAAAPAHA